jgi:Ca2+/Na+ antiporter
MIFWGLIYWLDFVLILGFIFYSIAATYILSYFKHRNDDNVHVIGFFFIFIHALIFIILFLDTDTITSKYTVIFVILYIVYVIFSFNVVHEYNDGVGTFVSQCIFIIIFLVLSFSQVNKDVYVELNKDNANSLKKSCLFNISKKYVAVIEYKFYKLSKLREKAKSNYIKYTSKENAIDNEAKSLRQNLKKNCNIH